MPLISTVGAAAARSFGLLGQSGIDSRPYWIGQAWGTDENVGGSVTTDQNGNIYLSGYLQPTLGNNDMLLMKLNPAGSVIWQKRLAGTGVDIAYAVRTDPAGNVYVAGVANISGVNKVEVAKYDSSGGLIWQQAVGTASNASTTNLAVDTLGNIYIAASSASLAVVFKLNTSGTMQWQTTLSYGVSYTPSSIGLDPFGNICVTGQSVNLGTYYIITAVLNSSGVLQWQRAIPNANAVEAGGCAFDNNSNVYVTSGISDGSVYFGVTTKYSSSGIFQWQRKFGSVTNNIHWLTIAVDPARNVYAVGYDTISYPDDKAQIVKYDEYGNLIWQRRLTSSSVDAFIGAWAPTGSAVYVNGYSTAQGYAGLLFGKLPVNGSGTGTYSINGFSFTYQSSTITDVAGTYTYAVGALVSGSGTLTVAPTGLSGFTSTLVSAIATLP